MLTVYEDGRVIPNSAALELFGPDADGLCFYAPPPARPGYTPKLWQVAAGDCHLYRTVESNGHIRLRAAGDCPPAGRYLFTPVVGEPGRYALAPAG
ncbi:hypothetical protein LJ737_20810 [Hymenobacter sp. 15J16-1T3B]|nr:hypothetical protein [Hymenobacter sp. 15J16-1T3B]